MNALSRRTLLMQIASGAIGSATFPLIAQAEQASTRIKAIAFDAFPIFDPRPIFQACEQLFPGQGVALSNVWRTRQFEYQWLRALGGRYRDFWNATQSALEFAAASLKIRMSPEQRDLLMQGYMHLHAWPDVARTLDALKMSGLKLALLSNATPDILESGVRTSGLQNVFDHIISTDRIRTFKPDPRAYRLGVEALELHKAEVLFVAFAGWDVAGAKWFGYPTFWNNRQAVHAEALDATPDGTGATLEELAKFLGVTVRG